MDDVIIREAGEDDYKRICELNKNCFGYDYPVDKTRERLKSILSNPADRIWAAESEGSIIGYVHGSDYDCTYFDPLKNIMAIVVDYEFRGKGVGRRLLLAVEDWARATGCAGVRLVSGFNRAEAHKFYLRCGYSLRKEQKTL